MAEQFESYTPDPKGYLICAVQPSFASGPAHICTLHDNLLSSPSPFAGWGNLFLARPMRLVCVAMLESCELYSVPRPKLADADTAAFAGGLDRKTQYPYKP